MSTINDPWYSVGSPVDSLTVSSTGGPYTLTGDVTGISVPWTGTSSNTITLDHSWNNQASGKLKLDGPEADIEVNGQSLITMLKNIEQRLNILRPNPELESEWEELRKLGDAYRALESQIQAKMKTWEAISK
jgi:hypothetical protein